MGHLTVYPGNIAGNLTKIFQKSQMPRGLPGGGGMGGFGINRYIKTDCFCGNFPNSNDPVIRISKHLAKKYVRNHVNDPSQVTKSEFFNREFLMIQNLQ